MKEKVLLVDDDKDYLEAISERMTSRDVDVTSTLSAEDALEKIKETSYDAIILDLQMPGMDGIETLKAIKAIQPETQVILVTGHGSVGKSVEAMKLGAMDFIEKPADIEELTRRIKEAQALKMVIVQDQLEDRVKAMLRRFGF